MCCNDFTSLEPTDSVGPSNGSMVVGNAAMMIWQISATQAASNLTKHGLVNMNMRIAVSFSVNIRLKLLMNMQGGFSGNLSQAQVQATRVLAEDFAGANHLETFPSVYDKAKSTMACWLERLASGPSPKGPGH